MKIPRRDLLLSGWKLGGALLAVAAGWTSYETLRPLVGTGTGGRIRLGSASDFKPGTATYFNEGRLWLANANGHFFALSPKCPHLGCRVPFCDSSGRFECPCHGSVFDIAGEWIEGPAPHGMDRYELSAEGQTLVADTSKVTTGPDRGAKDFFSPARGPSCATRS